MTDWFEACATCETPDSCLAVLYTVLGENRGMKALHDMQVHENEGVQDPELMTGAGALVSASAVDTAGRLAQIGCGHDGLAIQQMLTRGTDSGR